MSHAVLTAAVTGPIATKRDNPNVPIEPEEIAAAALSAYENGAAVVHVHPRGPDGMPTPDRDVVRRTLALIEESCPILVQVSTGVSLHVDFDQRAGMIEARPPMASLNVCSMTFGEGEFSNPPHQVRRLAARMRELGVKPEVELYDTGHADFAVKLYEEDLLEPPLQASIVLGIPSGGIAATPENLLRMVGALPEDTVWQVIGVGRQHLQMTALGLALGGNARTGMEDTLHMRKGSPVTGNGELVARLAQVSTALERPPATPEEARAVLGLPVRVA